MKLFLFVGEEGEPSGPAGVVELHQAALLQHTVPEGVRALNHGFTGYPVFIYFVCRKRH